MPAQTKVADLLDTVADSTAFQDLLGVVQSRSALALVGAGFSQRVGYPSWDKLLNEMADRLDAERARHGNGGVQAVVPVPELLRRHEDFLWRAEELRQRLDEDVYHDFLRTRFAPRQEEDPCLDTLVRLPFRHILTTNYDDSIEQAYRRTHENRNIDVVVWDDGTNARQMMYDLLHPNLPRRLVYLHGRIGEQVNVILTDRDYAERYLRNDSTVRKLFAIFAMQRLVLFGFSLRDPDLSAIMRQVAGALGYDRARHFAFVGLKAGDGESEGEDREIERRRFRQKYGVDAIFYDAANSHLLLKVLMDHMLAVCEGRARPSGSAIRAVSTAEHSTQTEYADVTISDADSVVFERNIADTKRQSRMNPRVPDDPRKGMFGGKPVDEIHGCQLTATVTPSGSSKTLFAVRLEVSSLPGYPALNDAVLFYLHNTFRPSEVAVEVVHGKAVLNLVAYGAFTVGAITAEGAELELDLVTVEAPQRFLEN